MSNTNPLNLKFDTTNKIGDLTFLGSVLVTPDMATELLKNNIGNRRLNEKRVASYAKDMKSNNWYAMPDGLTITVDKKWIILNGQHRLHAIVKSGTPTTLYFCQKDIEANAEAVVTDVGLNRSLAMIMGVSTNYISTITVTIKIGTDHSKRVAVSEVEAFEKKVTEDELDFLQKLGSKSKKGASAGVKAAFFYAYLETHSQRVITDWNDFISENEYNPITNKLWMSINKNSTNGSSKQVSLANLTYGILNGYSGQKIAASREQTLSWFKELYARLMNR